MSDYRHPLTGHGEGCLCPRCDEVAVTISRTELERLQKAASGNINRFVNIAHELAECINKTSLHEHVKYPMAVFGLAMELLKEFRKLNNMPPLFTSNRFYMMRDALWDVGLCPWCRSVASSKCPSYCQIEPRRAP